MTDNVYDPIGWRFCVAPMLDLTDRHCRYFHRLLSHRARLYTEMMTTGALVHGDVPHHLDFSEAEHRVALQLGGSDPKDLAHGAKLAQQWGYDEVNLNCGCPSERVQKGSFGACLMAEPGLVADCVKAMQDATHLPVTIKHRVGIDANNDYGFVRDFVGTLFNAGVRVFIVHARNAWLKGLSPKENREIPPLRREVVYQLKKDFPEAIIVINGALQDQANVKPNSNTWTALCWVEPLITHRGFSLMLMPAFTTTNTLRDARSSDRRHGRVCSLH